MWRSRRASRVNAEILINLGGYVLKDQGSLNGTTWKGETMIP
ncbi:FHA domain-containing protein [Paenibacillus sp. NPDC056722]